MLYYCKQFSWIAMVAAALIIIVARQLQFFLKREYHACSLAFSHVSTMEWQGKVKAVSAVQEKTCTQQCYQATRSQECNCTIHNAWEHDMYMYMYMHGSVTFVIRSTC